MRNLLYYILLLGFLISFTAAWSQDSEKAAQERERIFNMLQQHENLIKVGKAIDEYRTKYGSGGDGEGLGPIMRKYHLMRERARLNGEFEPAVISKELQKVKSLRLPSKEQSPGWTEMGPRTSSNVTGHWAPGIGRIDVIEVNPANPDQIFVGTPTGGLWKTTDGGENWACMNENLPVIGVAGMAIDWNNPDIIYLGTGDKDAGDVNSVGVYKSVDGGNSWTQTNLTFDVNLSLNIRSMKMHPSDPSTIFVGYTNGMYKTTDGGATWVKVLDSGNYNEIDDIEFKPGDPDILYAVSYSTSRFYKSTDGGNSFVAKDMPYSFDDRSRLKVEVTEANPEYVYVLTTSAIYRSANSGESFVKTGDYPVRA